MKRKSWSHYTVVQLRRRLRKLGLKVSGKKATLIRRLASACRKGAPKRKKPSCKRRKIRKGAKKRRRVVRRKKPIYSAAGKNLDRIRRDAKRYGVKQSGKKASVIARIRAKLAKKKRR